MPTLQGKHLHLDPQSGIAGDMTVAALVDAGVPARVVTDAVAAMKVAGLKTGFAARKRGAFAGLGFLVTWPGGPTGQPPSALPVAEAGHHHDHADDGHAHEHLPTGKRRIQAAGPAAARSLLTQAKASPHHHHRDYADIRRLLDGAKLDDDVKALAHDIFARIAEAEGALHGVDPEKVSFHEVGAYDSIADILGVAAAIVWLEPSAISSSPPVLGTGQARTAHGWVAIPAPATAALLLDVPVRSEGVGELTTPTGAAILAAVVDRFGDMPPMRLVAQGFGAGTKDLSDRANVLRVLIGDPLGAAMPASAGEVLVIQANVDDMSPQLVEPLMESLFKAGALDAWATPIVMKKGRPAWELSAMAPADKRAEVEWAFFQNSTTIGLRVTPAGRTVLARSLGHVETAFGSVSVKISVQGDDVLGVTPEFEDCRRLASKAQVSVREVLAQASAAAATFKLNKGKPQESSRRSRAAGRRRESPR